MPKRILIVEDMADALRVDRLARAVADLEVRATEAAGFGCFMLAVAMPEIPLFAQRAVDPATLVEDGIETEPHVTVFYGFPLGFDAAQLQGVINAAGAITIELGKVSRFECPDYDVLKLDVQAPALDAMHQQIAQEFAEAVTPSKHTYRPHLTLAYVAKGTNKELDGNTIYAGLKVQGSHMVYSEPNHTNRRLFAIGCLEVKATESAPEPPGPIPEAAVAVGVTLDQLDAHEAARQAAERIYSKALHRYVTAAEAAAMKRERTKKETEELLIYWLLLMDDAAEQAYLAAGGMLAQAMPGGTPPPNMADAAAFAANRRPLVEPAGQTILERLDKVVQQGRNGYSRTTPPEPMELPDRAILPRLHQEGADIEKGQGAVISSTESQAVYGHAQLRLLQRAGFAMKYWQTQEDDRVRPTHEHCQAEGPIPLHKRFSNGLLYPGDPAGGPEECANCRCDLLPAGERAKP